MLVGPGRNATTPGSARALLVEPVFQQPGTLGDARRLALRLAPQKRGCVIPHGGEAARLEKHNRDAGGGQRKQGVRVHGGTCPRIVEQALGNQRPAAAAARRQRHAFACRIDQRSGRHPDTGGVEVGERVVEQQHVWRGGARPTPRASRCECRRECLPAPRRQRPPAIEPQHALVQPSGRRGAERPVRQRREPASKARHVVDVSKRTGGQRRAVTRPVARQGTHS